MTHGFAAKRLWAAIIALVFLPGCRGTQPERSSADDSPAQTLTIATQIPDTAPRAVLVACAQVEATLGALPADSLTVSRVVVIDYLADRSGPGCRVRLVGARSRYADDARPDDVARRNLPREGWHENLRYAADGPDGTGFALTRQRVICMFQGMWDGGDDSDPTYVPADRYALEVNCLASEPEQSDPRP